MLNKHGQLNEPVLNLRNRMCRAEDAIGWRVCIYDSKVNEHKPKGAFILEIVDHEAFVLQPVPVGAAVWTNWVMVLREGIQLVEISEADARKLAPAFGSNDVGKLDLVAPEETRAQVRSSLDGPSRRRRPSRARRARRRRRAAALQLQEQTGHTQNRRARRAADPVVQQRAADHAARVAAEAERSGAEESGAERSGPAQGKRTYSIEQMLALRPGPAPASLSAPLLASAPIFTPHAQSYMCYARASHLGLADGPVRVFARPVMSAIAREWCARVHALLCAAP